MNTIERDSWSKHNFTITRTQYYEEYPDLSYLGEYVQYPQYGCIDRKHMGDWHSHNQLRYFVPEPSLDYHKEWFIKHGYSKHQTHEIAKSYVLDNYKRMEAFNDGVDYMVTVSVSISYKGRELGDFVVGGFTSDDDYENDVYPELTREALADAVKYLKDIAPDSKALRQLERLSEAYDRLTVSKPVKYTKKFDSWRDLSQEYQKNNTLTRHAKRKLSDKNKIRLTYFGYGDYRNK